MVADYPATGAAVKSRHFPDCHPHLPHCARGPLRLDLHTVLMRSGARTQMLLGERRNPSPLDHGLAALSIVIQDG